MRRVLTFGEKSILWSRDQEDEEEEDDTESEFEARHALTFSSTKRLNFSNHGSIFDAR